MNDTPYTTPEEDPFNVQPLLQPRRRRSSLLDKWIYEQQKKTDQAPPPSPHNNQYLAYPELGSDPNSFRDDVVTLDNYDLVNDDDIPPQVNFSDKEVPATPTTARTRRASKLLNTPSSFCNFNLPFRSSSPAASSLQDSGSPRSRFSFLPRTPRHSTDATIVIGKNSSHQHNRSTSLSTLSITGQSPCFSDVPNASSSTKWRPSVLGHFAASSTSQASVPSDTAYTPSRPSMSSGDTYTSGTGTTTESDLPMTPSRMNFMDSIRFRSKPNVVFNSGSGIMSSSSLRSQKLRTSLGHSSTPALSSLGYSGPGTASTSTLAHRTQTTRTPLAPKPTSRLANSNLDHGDDDDGDDDTYHPVVQTVKQHDLTRPHVAYPSGGTLPRVNLASLSSRHRKKKKLIVSGIGPNEARKFEGVKRWCESFGEVSQIVRMPNGDLHVHFRLAEVADTVCRLRAKVYIAGVGSVQLSWFTGDKR
ncbi:hypothetical protein D9615_001328 [Tricholomella constricta]|uniref:Uncharacterized protein n=1 Tax=Tricholomella constricta TaxID=117010 RepID=A0A8H5HL14_9AGAR|nr:hypothetical protein D9615_001328 [Tricholomella constricta]